MHPDISPSFKHLVIQTVRVKNDSSTGLQAIIALHEDSKPAIGGCRIVNTSFNEALNDVCELANAMFLKAKTHSLPFGGGKSIIINPPQHSREEWLKSFAQFVDEFQGRYITAIDSGSTPQDMGIISNYTPHVLSSSTQPNTSLATAKGVFQSIKAAINYKFGNQLSNKKILIEGLGAVGTHLAQLLLKENCQVYGYDIHPSQTRKASSMGVQILQPSDAFNHAYDVFSPCGLGGSLNKDNIHNLQASIVCGAANNPLSTPMELSKTLQDLNITYIPDVLVNAGGLVYVSLLHINESEAYINEKIENFYHMTHNLLIESSKKNHSPLQTLLINLNQH